MDIFKMANQLAKNMSENDKIFYLTPEEAIKNKITDYSAAIN